MNGKKSGEFEEFSGLAERLGRADFSGESRVKDVLRESLLGRVEKRSRRSAFVWLLPAAAAAALLLFVNIRHRPGPGAALAAAYNLPADGYGQCGRQGLEDYMAEGRF
ncbi:MAG: hypothetical protein A2X35_00655 [Elusimicrobia bacterium GWA2_61_42]|nr:MAG: hypothetical protein A2X35_00655 [Elusimicrobia bacterium GWA2_61_42]OGR77199.1 MAG: hypothetical protein A2X38_12780 [Elusimicrobia bacterium GWC2_61_25]